MKTRHEQLVVEFNELTSELGVKKFIDDVETCNGFDDWAKKCFGDYDKRYMEVNLNDVATINGIAFMNKLMERRCKNSLYSEWFNKYVEKLVRLGDAFDNMGDFKRGDWTLSILRVISKYYG